MYNSRIESGCIKRRTGPRVCYAQFFLKGFFFIMGDLVYFMYLIPWDAHGNS
jgi:hypothetical protein